jgi:hypothetical protein
LGRHHRLARGEHPEAGAAQIELRGVSALEKLAAVIVGLDLGLAY